MQALELWSAISTQWRVGFGGPYGLDYNAMYLVAGTMRVEMTPKMLRKMRRLEADALTAMSENNEGDD